MKALSSADLPSLRIWPSMTLHTPSPASRISSFYSTCQGTSHAQTTRRKSLMMSCWRHLMMSAKATSTWFTSVLATLSTTQLATLATRHLADCWPWLTRPGPPGSNPWALIVDFCLRWLWLFALTFDQKLKFSIGSILLSFLRRFRFWTPFLHLKLRNWSIGTLFNIISSRHFQVIFSCLYNLKSSSSFHHEFEGGC